MTHYMGIVQVQETETERQQALTHYKSKKTNSDDKIPVLNFNV